MENILKTLKLSEAVLKGVVTFPELDTMQKHLIGTTLEQLRVSIDELSNSHKHGVVRGGDLHEKTVPRQNLPLMIGNFTPIPNTPTEPLATEVEAQSQSDGFYCADWNRCGAICEEQCPACKKADRAELL